MGFEWIVVYLLLGAVVGFVAGLLGVGGGAIMVPMLTSIFALQGMPGDEIVHLALGTSMAAIIVTSFSSMRSHHAAGAVLWPVVGAMAPGIVAGTFVATFLAAMLSGAYLALFFAAFMAFVALQMFLNKKPKPSRALYGRTGLTGAGCGIGALSALAAIGGGTMTVPFLTWQNVDIKKAIGTSAAVGLPIAVAGTLGYVINGWSGSGGGSYTLGFVYLPAVVVISAASFVTAPLGARLAHKLPVATLKKVFALLLIVLSLKMLVVVL